MKKTNQSKTRKALREMPVNERAVVKRALEAMWGRMDADIEAYSVRLQWRRSMVKSGMLVCLLTLAIVSVTLRMVPDRDYRYILSSSRTINKEQIHEKVVSIYTNQACC